jgi:hypothetical protein
MSTDCHRNLPQTEGVCGDMIKYRPFLLLDIFLEGADRLCGRNLDREYVVGIIVVDEAVEFEDRDRRQTWRGDWMNHGQRRTENAPRLSRTKSRGLYDNMEMFMGSITKDVPQSIQGR